jgi:predicted nucleotide-binding protein (sugar kinase/HSP70/actin superfamily)
MISNSNGNGAKLPDLAELSLEDIDKKLAAFEAEERKRLGLPTKDPAQWYDPQPQVFTAEQRAHTTVLVCGLTMAHDLFIQSALRGIGYNVLALDVPDNGALQFGREYGNRGQCNPTYFTVGNLVKHLRQLEESGLTKDQIVENYVFVTAGACGPCRFGTYVTEYRKALRDSGFDGFRVLLFQQTGGLKQATGEEVGLEMNPTFFWSVVKAVIIGDVLNALAYRIRPYEVEPGSADAAMERSKAIIAECLENNGTLLKALYRVRREMGSVKVDRTRVKPKVAIIGEFWAMTTEGDGNYGLQRFLESEGAEVEVQLVTAWLLYMVWQGQYDTQERAKQRRDDGGRFGLANVDVRKRLLTLAAADKIVRGLFQSFAHALGLYDYHLADMDELAEVSHEFYDNNLRGGEGHMEVGKLILNVAKQKVNMTLSVKPFGCMPSSSVSDGVQSLITELYPEAIFLPIETNGDGAVNVYSRVQMQLFKAKQAAQKEVDRALEATGQTLDEVRAYLASHPRMASPFHKSPHVVGSTAADLIYEVAARRNRVRTVGSKIVKLWKTRGRDEARNHLRNVAKIAAAKARAAAARPKVTVAPEVPVDLDQAKPAVPAGRKILPVLN